ncbi:Vegetative incompatibility protein HET-E-1 [Lasiodiplodia theobromae]|uniref:Vegetative incompatibility protein HET-E-1 n=1 Tax=Lasiodiplodia theobromae TaxID=45133 RepID=UPI0015C3969A|nr:Vegetative incompatibility protein HET-E-1 [Lasiodiplodia theobromae]KAF4545816.1 Vegetative incompatibility protein HET-E-1 [Lasiodiplodia theobromae]
MDPGTGLAVFDLSVKVAKLCWEYYRKVKNAKSDIERLKEEVDRLKAPLEAAEKLLKSPNGQRLQAAQSLLSALQGCEAQLKELETKLKTKLEDTLKHGKIYKAMRKIIRRLGLSALKWPLESKDVDAIIATLEKHRNELSYALQIDQTAEILHIGQKLDLSKLPTAKDASFDSHADEHDARCLPETRVTLREDIKKWAEDKHSECIFWLNGMAGTGKSTISRTVAQSFADEGVLGASFFFKRGEKDRSSAALLFTTLAARLANIPILAAPIRKAIETDPELPQKALKEQFEHLLIRPLESFKGDPINPKRIVLVIDALDECERDDDVRVIIRLLSQARTLHSVRLRTFVTSRPELPIRLGFSNIEGQYQDLVLHKIPKPVIEHDIAAFLEHKLKEIRDECNRLSTGNPQLPSNWPGIEAIQTLTIPLAD